MKKIIHIISIAFIVLVLSSTSVFANTAFNDPAEMDTVTVSSTSGSNCSYGEIDGCWKTSDTARPGDTVTVQIYFKNTGYQAATQTVIGLNTQNFGSVSSATFKGGVAATNASSVEGAATVRITGGPATLTYIPGSARWYSTKISGKNRVVDSYLFGNGYIVGTIAPGEQGVLAADYKVGIVKNPTPDPIPDPNPTRDCSITSFTASPSTISRGDNSELSWSTRGCDYVRVTDTSTGTDLSNSNTNSYASVRPYSTRTYRLTAYPGGGTTTRTVYVNDDSAYCSIDSFTVNGSNSVTIDRGSVVTLTWYTTGVSSVDISPSYSGQYFSNQYADGAINVSPYASTTYTLSTNGGNCSRSRSVTVYVRGVVNIVKPQVITGDHVMLGYTIAQIAGIAIPNTSATTNAWFEWGTSSTSLNNRTSSQLVNSNSSTSYIARIDSLTVGTTYYYRAVIQNTNGTAYGDIKSFNTQYVQPDPIYVPTPIKIPVRVPVKVPVKHPVKQPVKTVKQPVRTVIQYVPVQAQPVQMVQPVIVKSAPSSLELRVESKYDRMCIGGAMDYAITYHNLSNSNLERSVIRIVLPKELTFVSSSGGYFEPQSRTLTLDLGTIHANEYNRITVRATVNELAVRGNLTVTTATVVYTNTINRAQENAMAYSLITVSDSCPDSVVYPAQTRTTFWWFLPHSLVEWLLLLLIIFALIVLGRQLQEQKK